MDVISGRAGFLRDWGGLKEFEIALTNVLLGEFPLFPDKDSPPPFKSSDLCNIVDDVVNNYFKEQRPGMYNQKSREWVKTVQSQLSNPLSDDVRKILTARRFPNLVSTPYQYKDLQVVPLLTALDLYDEERRQYNDLILEILSYLEGDRYVFAIRNRNNQSLSYFEVILDEFSKVSIGEHTGTRYDEPSKKCIGAAKSLVAHVNNLLSQSKITPQNLLSASEKATLERLKHQDDDSVDIHLESCRFLEQCYGFDLFPESVFDSTMVYKSQSVTTVMGKSTMEFLIEEIKTRLEGQYLSTN